MQTLQCDSHTTFWMQCARVAFWISYVYLTLREILIQNKANWWSVRTLKFGFISAFPVWNWIFKKILWIEIYPVASVQGLHFDEQFIFFKMMCFDPFSVNVRPSVLQKYGVLVKTTHYLLIMQTRFTSLSIVIQKFKLGAPMTLLHWESFPYLCLPWLRARYAR